MVAPKGGSEMGKRNPTVLVTDSRDLQRNRRNPHALPNPAARFITVDNVLQYASDMPSMQQRHPPPGRARPRATRISAVAAAAAAAAGGGGGGASSTAVITSGGSGGGVGAGVGGRAGDAGRPRSAGRLAALPHLPPRSTKISEKLVLLPETVIEEGTEDGGEEEEEEEEEEEGGVVGDEGGVFPAPAGAAATRQGELIGGVATGETAEEKFRRVSAERKLRSWDFAVDNELAPLLAEEEAQRRRRVAPEQAKSYAERLPKARRAEKLPRVTAYCTAQGYKMSLTAAFVKASHDARTKLYDDCLYTAYHLPLLPGREGYRIRSSPIIRSAEGKVVLDEEIARNEQRDYHDEYYAEQDEHSVQDHHHHHHHDHGHGHHDAAAGKESQKREGETYGHHHDRPSGREQLYDFDKRERADDGGGHGRARAASIPPNALSFAEMFVFSYGVVVFWNFSERQEIDVLADLAFACSQDGLPMPLSTNGLAEADFETEEFHFEYSTRISRPRVYNDMITLRSGDHMIKLAISHGIAQSTKLSFFEEVMAKQMAEAKDVPRRLALTGHLGMQREEVFRIMGKLFKSRVEVNLSSNMLDVPNFFWDSEPTLHPLYTAVREYLEIKPRIQVLNERCRVFLDLIEILSDSIADNKMSRQTWIIIVLIFISIIVTLAEVILRFGILSTRLPAGAAKPSRLVAPARGQSMTGGSL
ncbi:Sad1-interacting factor 3 [Ophidiomyces ophidiicola]|nr:Sad1-interacting factor 3 [Ophidiomyces ophidiicola]KAI2004699.1 Sad1-interacting factor 3 [Ophidiomyces ophidiicola]KAI2028792.1 Sad1-interacting factor 3 [Ophidiomyces ophidiicola]KAI2029083.1 Sad1-interacting factor 3 [Ophidiomyces ophidiicola]KAI2123882.1 Sad1-interacting factor 3 [Ophidiomyces ophidiicola]